MVPVINLPDQQRVISSTTTTTTAKAKKPNVAPFHPPADTSTYRDLLLFEERLKMNAEMLRRRRRRYGIFLWSFVVILTAITYKLVFQPPQLLLALRALQTCFTVILITLALFFASGMYDEKIRYANSYINHSNKALRPLNMHLNMRRPKWSLLGYLPFTSQLIASDSSTSPSSSTTLSSQKPNSNKSSHTVMTQIPPTTNPRGELIFSLKVDRNFREGYERYRAAFERRREERVSQEARMSRSWVLRVVRVLGVWVGVASDSRPPSGGVREKVPSSSSSVDLSRRRTPSPSVGSSLAEGGAEKQ